MKKNLSILLIFLSVSAFSQDIEWGYSLGGSYIDNCYDIEIDSFQNIYLTGGFCNSVDFDLKGNHHIVSANGTDKSDIFIAKYNSNQELKYAFGLNGTSWDYATDLEIDNIGNVYISGFYSGIIDFDPLQTNYYISSSESMFFIAKYDSIGSFKWAKNICKKKDNWRPTSAKMYSDENSTIYISTPDTLYKIDFNGNVKWTTSTSGFAVFDFNSNFYILSNSLTPWGNEKYENLSLMKIDTSGVILSSSEIISCSTGNASGYLTFDKSGYLIINGGYWGTCEFINSQTENISLSNNNMTWCPIGPGQVIECPEYHEYLAKFDTIGNIIWAHDFGTNGPSPYIIRTTEVGIIYTLGFLNFSADFDYTENTSVLTNTGYGYYIAKYDQSCNFLGATKFMGGSYNDFIGDFKLYDDSTAFICGHFFNTIDLDLNNTTYYLSANPPEDIFFAKYSCFDIQDNSINSLQLIEKKSEIKIYPNPVNYAFRVSFQGAKMIEEIIIYNIKGQKVQIISNYEVGSLIDIGSFSNGIYLIEFTVGDLLFREKFIKQ